MKTKQQYRQGDVFIERIESIPSTAKAVKAKAGSPAILAYGEVTGHHHSIVAERFADEQGGEFFRVEGQKLKFRLPIEREWRGQVMVRHPRIGLIEFARADIEVDGKEAVVNGRYGVLKHQEHNAQAIPAGCYRGSGNAAAVVQSEYSPAEIRRVAD